MSIKRIIGAVLVLSVLILFVKAFVSLICDMGILRTMAMIGIIAVIGLALDIGIHLMTK